MDHQAEVGTKGAFIVRRNDVLGAADARVVAAPVLDAHAKVFGEISRQRKKFLGRSARLAELILPPSFFEAAPVKKLSRISNGESNWNHAPPIRLFSESAA